MPETITALRREALAWLSDTVTTYMATTESGQPRVRPVSILWRDDAVWVTFFDEFWDGPDDPRYTLIRVVPHEILYLRPEENLHRALYL
jgi:hypothetical protein